VADDLAVHEAIAAALAGGREPDLSAFDASDVRAALERALLSPARRRDFLAWLDGRVRALSGGTTSIEERADEDGSERELPLRLVAQGEPFAEPVVVRASSRPVEFPMRG
jgi:hypothetical protein